MKSKTIVKLIITALLLTLPLGVFADKSFKFYSNQMMAINAKPKKNKEVLSIFIFHPMIKNKETKVIYYSAIKWNGKDATRTYIDFKNIKGRATKRGKIIGRTFKYHYKAKILIQLCTSTKMSSWKKSNNLRLHNRTYFGYSFLADIGGDLKKCIIYLNRDGSLYAFSFGYSKKGISHGKTMKDSGTIWYFKNINGKLRIVKILKSTVQKIRGIPIMKISTQTFSQF